MALLAAFLCHGGLGVISVAVGTLHHRVHRRVLAEIVTAQALLGAAVAITLGKRRRCDAGEQ